MEAYARSKLREATAPLPKAEPEAPEAHDGQQPTLDPAQQEATAAACELFCVLSVRPLGLQRGLLQELLSAYGQAPAAARCVDQLIGLTMVVWVLIQYCLYVVVH